MRSAQLEPVLAQHIGMPRVQAIGLQPQRALHGDSVHDLRTLQSGADHAVPPVHAPRPSNGATSPDLTVTDS